VISVSCESRQPASKLVEAASATSSTGVMDA
jgi:hypothetical protein